MPYNTTAIPPRKEPTGQTQLPLSRAKKIIGQDSDIGICSNNAAFVITLAAEMFVQHLADEAHTQAKLERKPRRNIQYKDVANAVSHLDNLEFLEDVVPKTVPYKKIKAAARATQARLRGENVAEPGSTAQVPVANGDSTTASASKPVNGGRKPFAVPSRPSLDDRSDDPNAQLELEMRQAAGASQDDDDVTMSG